MILQDIPYPWMVDELLPLHQREPQFAVTPGAFGGFPFLLGQPLEEPCEFQARLIFEKVRQQHEGIQAFQGPAGG